MADGVPGGRRKANGHEKTQSISTAGSAGQSTSAKAAYAQQQATPQGAQSTGGAGKGGKKKKNKGANAGERALNDVSERERADRSMASLSATWYAGSCFELSPEPDALPMPTRLLATLNAPSVISTQDASFATVRSHHPSDVLQNLPGTTGHTRPTDSNARLEAMSEDLRRMLHIQRGPL